MKRLFIYIVIIGLSFAAPVKKADVARLSPVEAVAVAKENSVICITTDTGEYGQGETVKEALNDMKQNSTSLVYLDTAKYLLITEEAKGQINQLKEEMRGSVKLCIWDGETDVKDAVKYLTIHGNMPRLSQCSPQTDLPRFSCKKFS